MEDKNEHPNIKKLTEEKINYHWKTYSQSHNVLPYPALDEAEFKAICPIMYNFANIFVNLTCWIRKKIFILINL